MIFIQWLLIHSLADAQGIVNESSSEELAVGNGYEGSTRRTLEPSLGHHVLVVYTRSFCSGSIIHSKVVLTVASCFHQKSDYGIKVKFAVRNYMEAGPSVGVAEKKEHEFYKNKGDLDNDIALLILKKHINFGFGERKIILAESGTELPVNSHLTVTGWGKDVSKSQENEIIQSDMQVIERGECDKTYPKIVFPSLFCAKYDLANQLSDNGGAAVFNGFLVGISSYGANLDEPPLIALFTNVSYFYKWIKLNTEKLLLKHCSKELGDTESAIQDY